MEEKEEIKKIESSLKEKEDSFKELEKIKAEIDKTKVENAETLEKHKSIKDEVSQNESKLHELKNQQIQTQNELDELNSKIYNAKQELENLSSKVDSPDEKDVLSKQERELIESDTFGATKTPKNVIEAASAVAASLKSKLNMKQKELETVQNLLQRERDEHDKTKQKLDELIGRQGSK